MKLGGERPPSRKQPVLKRTPGRESPGDNQPPRNFGVDHEFMYHKATAQIRDLRAELTGVLEHDKRQLDLRTEHTADRAGHLIVGVVAILERMIGQVTTIQRSPPGIYDSYFSAKQHLNDASNLLNTI